MCAVDHQCLFFGLQSTCEFIKINVGYYMPVICSYASEKRRNGGREREGETPIQKLKFEAWTLHQQSPPSYREVPQVLIDKNCETGSQSELSIKMYESSGGGDNYGLQIHTESEPCFPGEDPACHTSIIIEPWHSNSYIYSTALKELWLYINCRAVYIQP